MNDVKIIEVEIKKLPNGMDLPIPSYASNGSAGVDLYAATNGDEILKAGEIKLISTGIAIKLPKHYEAQVRPRSGLAIKHGISLVNSPGTIDADYRGEIKLIMINHGKEDFLIKHGMRIAQMVICALPSVGFKEVDELDKTARNDSGFGSTGV